MLSNTLSLVSEIKQKNRDRKLFTLICRNKIDITILVVTVF